MPARSHNEGNGSGGAKSDQIDSKLYFKIAPAINVPATGKARMILFRNGESCDRLVSSWRSKAFANDARYRMVDLNQPIRIPSRQKAFDTYKNDSPLTSVGSICSQLVGRAMSMRSIRVHTVFCSPALRCVQSCSALLSALGQKHQFRIKIEPGLFEPLSFYWEDRVPEFFTPAELSAQGHSIDMDYKPVVSLEELRADLFQERTPLQAYNRVQCVVERLLEICRQSEGATLLICCHAPSLDAILRNVQGRSDIPRTQFDLYRMGLNYPFCSTTVLERDARSEGSGISRWQINSELIPSLTAMHVSTQVRVPTFPV